MPLATGTRLGAYEVLGPIGAGGMGEVYKARDVRLERDVAIKILPPHVASDITLKQRFEREAKALAALSHPHICAVFDTGHASTEHGEIDFLVMEYLEGQTLARRLERGALPLAEALRYAIQLADALDQAHRKGVVHRDFKPGNIVLTPVGAKILDFGLARIQSSAEGAVNPAAAPTATSPLTGTGTLVGTFQYMAPEQLEGRQVDSRTDIFAYGEVLYEMLTGRKPFESTSQAGLIGAILEREPPPASTIQTAVTPALDQLVKTCLTKDPNRRWQSAGDIARQLSWILDDSSLSGKARAVPSVGVALRRVWLVPAMAITAVAAAIGVAVWTMTRSPALPAPQVSRLTLAPSANAPVVSVLGIDVLITPDGKRIVYLGAREGGRVFYLRELDSLESRPIRGTELPSGFETANPFITSDGKAVVFRSPSKGILGVPLGGGLPVTLAEESLAASYLGGTSAADDTVVLAIDNGLFRTSAKGGGTLDRLTPREDGVLFVAPSAVPGGNAILFHKRNLREQVNRVFVLDLRTRNQHELVPNGGSARYAPSGHLVFARDTTLMAMPFNISGLTVTGAPVAVQEGIQHPAAVSAPDYSLSENGTLIYVPALTSPLANTTPMWVDRSGRELGPAVAMPMPNFESGRLSPDGKRLAFSVGGIGNRDLWVYDLTGRPPLRLAERFGNISPLWSPDGGRIVFVSNRDGRYDLYSIPSDGAALEPTRVEHGSGTVSGRPTVLPETWMPDGRLVVTRGQFTQLQSAVGDTDILIAPTSNGGKAEPLVQTTYAEESPRVSPNGQWLAYRSDRSGRFEIWVQPLTGGAPVRVSSNGGSQPLWSSDGRELFYREGTKMMTVRFKTGTELAFETVQLFDRPYREDFNAGPDGRFLMIPTAVQSVTPPTGIVVVQNWHEELKQRVPTN